MKETYNRLRVRKHLSDMFPIKIGLKPGNAFSPLFFSFALDYAIWWVQVNQDGLN
jgi:hypothetical protein